MFKHEIHEDETLLKMYRTHEITLVPKVLRVFILIFIPWYIGIKYDFIFSTKGHTIIFLFWTLLVALYALNSFLLWSLNTYLVTSKRLLHIHYTGLFNKMVKETPLDRILNVSFGTKGIFSTMFGYGDVFVQVVGLDHPLVLKNVPQPSDVKDFIWQIHLSYGGDQKITFTKPEIAPVEKYIPYAPKMDPQLIVKNKPLKEQFNRKSID